MGKPTKGAAAKSGAKKEHPPAEGSIKKSTKKTKQPASSKPAKTKAKAAHEKKPKKPVESESDSMSEDEVPVKKRKGSETTPEKSRKAKTSKATEEDEASQDENESNFSQFPLSSKTIECLHKRGITTLFPIQAMTFMKIYEGKDLIGRARTGTGKTLSYLLPVLEKLEADGVSKLRGHKVLIMCPTRELAKQVGRDIEVTAPHLSMCTIYGGTDYRPQVQALHRGVDILVGTPGRIIDHINNGTMKLCNIRCVILDEADEMLNIGFADAMEQVLEGVKKALHEAGGEKHQTLLFSATVPSWVKQVASKYLKPDHVTVDLSLL